MLFRIRIYALAFLALCFGTNEGCPKGYHLCKDEMQCVGKSEWCDGWRHCDDGSDERNCTGCGVDAVHCNDGLQCIGKGYSCDSRPNCLDGSDEWFCNACQQQVADGRLQCVGRKEPCDDRRVQVKDKWVKVTHCSNEKDKKDFQATNNKTTCRQLMGPCEGRRDRVCGNGQWVCEEVTQTSLSRCSNGNLISSPKYCDNAKRLQCNDDEIKTGLGFKCSGPIRKGICVLPQINIYDDEPQCADKSDLCFVDGQFVCFLCLDKRLVISQQQVCNGVPDCYDLSDECLCDNQLHCRRNETECVGMDKVLCNPKISCLNESNKQHCATKGVAKLSYIECLPNLLVSSTLLATRCDGRPECLDLKDECEGCEVRPKFCTVECMRRRARKGIACQGIKESTCNESGLCPKRHECANGQLTSIDVNNLCDGIIDCDDGSDEDATRCSTTRFYCRNGKPLSVDIKLVEDGFPQCSDESDECPPISKKSSTFSDQKEMIGNPVYRTFFWLMGFVAATGNLVVLVVSIKDVVNIDNRDNFKKSNYVFLISLSSADLLMGVYLIVISIKGREFSGEYCSFDSYWRSSSFCSFLGVVCVVATMASSGTMAVMAAFRLISVCKPYIARTFKLKWVYFSCVLVWLLSIALADIPLFDYSSGYFVSHVWLSSRFFQTDQVLKQKIMHLANKIKPHNMTSLHWHDVTQLMSKTFPNQPIKGIFGYYGETSVCMPRLFASSNDASWQYSVFLITLNFLLFIFMLVAYIIVYIKSNKMAHARNRGSDTNLQKRISRLLITDFCCWIPMCVLAYLAVSGVPLPNDIYIISAGILLPINSALNPLLYSTLIERCCVRLKQLKTSVLNRNAGDVNIGMNDM